MCGRCRPRHAGQPAAGLGFFLVPNACSSRILTTLGRVLNVVGGGDGDGDVVAVVVDGCCGSDDDVVDCCVVMGNEAFLQSPE